MSSQVLQLEGVSRSYGQGATAVAALRNVSLTINAGEFVAVMGPSGSGKSSLLTLAGGLDKATSGNVFVEGTPLGGLSINELARLRRRAVGYVFQDFNLVPALTAAENVSLPRELDGIAARKARRQANDALRLVGIEDLADRFMDQMSGGQQQRVAIARAIVGQRRLILADEPTGALDSATGDGILEVLRGTVLGVVAGAIPVIVVLSLQRGFPIVLPWLQMGALVILVPLFGAAAAWMLTKGKLPMTRRQTLA